MGQTSQRNNPCDQYSCCCPLSLFSFWRITRTIANFLKIKNGTQNKPNSAMDSRCAHPGVFFSYDGTFRMIQRSLHKLQPFSLLSNAVRVWNSDTRPESSQLTDAPRAQRVPHGEFEFKSSKKNTFQTDRLRILSMICVDKRKQYY